MKVQWNEQITELATDEAKSVRFICFNEVYTQVKGISGLDTSNNARPMRVWQFGELRSSKVKFIQFSVWFGSGPSSLTFSFFFFGSGKLSLFSLFFLAFSELMSRSVETTEDRMSPPKPDTGNSEKRYLRFWIQPNSVLPQIARMGRIWSCSCTVAGGSGSFQSGTQDSTQRTSLRSLNCLMLLCFLQK